ncbi:MAG: imidazole glycerol phosphate synthase subunit HisH [Bacteroidota bacterium]|nr:imidazole glycerol phosphate synthase subunit HisH [Bacteroidota bacterium]
MKIVIIDYGLGNPMSIKNMLKKCGAMDVELSHQTDKLFQADRLILPGVGHFKKGMDNLSQLGLISILNELVIDREKPILGICLGMQLMTSFSEEGHILGLNWIEAQTNKFKFGNPDIKIPHMGWNDTEFVKQPFNDLDFEENPPRFYYTHSYFVECKDETDVLCYANYEKKFHAGFLKNNIMGLQFHPEKSHVFGQKLLSEFLNWKP